MTNINLPSSGWTDPTQHRVMVNIAKAANASTAATSGLTDGAGRLVIPAIEQAWSEAVTLDYAEDRTYPLIEYMERAATIDSVVTRCRTGSCTVTVKINGSAIGGSTNSVTTTRSTTTHTTSNTLAVGDVLDIVVSSNSGAEGVNVTLIGRSNQAAA